MKNPINIAIALAALWIIFKCVFYAYGLSDESFVPGVLINVFFVLVTGSFGLYMARRKNNFSSSHFLDDYKNALKGSVVFSILISVFVYVYYSQIDPSYMERKITSKIEMAEKQVATDAKFDQLVEQNPNLRKVSKKEYVANVKDDAQTIHSAYVQSTLSLLALMVLSLIYGLGVTVIFRKIVFRG